MNAVGRASALVLVASTLVLALKVTAALITGSVALLADAAESLVNVAAAAAAFYAVRLARRPPDYEHPYGHAKAEYLSGALEGSMILVAAGVILASAIPRLLAPPELHSIPTGLVVVLAASVVNAVLALFLRRVTRRHPSPALAASSRHLLTDVWTSMGIVAAVAVVALDGPAIIDPLVGLAVGLHVLREGWQVVAGALSSLLDVRLPDAEEERLIEVLRAESRVLGFHRLRSRQSGFNRFLEVDIFVDPELDVRHAHDIASGLERRIAARLPNVTATIHIEPYLEGERDTTLTPREEFDRGGGSEDAG